jgi:hypothetical protein
MKYSLTEEQINGFLNEVSNPALRNLFRMMLNNQQQQEELPPSRRITLSKAVEDVKHLLEINKAMKIALNELKSENEKMVERYRMLTKALGACECLGENVICPICHGKGVPGTFLIDERAFNKYVYPLIQRITQTVEQSNAVEEKKETTHSQNGKLHTKKNGLST